MLKKIGTLLFCVTLSFFTFASTAHAVTATPTLISPANGSTFNETIHIQYSLPDVPASNTVELILTNTATSGVITINMSNLQTPNFTAQRTSLYSSGQIMAVTPAMNTLPYGNYNIILAYQNAAFDPVATSSVSNFTIAPVATATPTATITAAPTVTVTQLPVTTQTLAPTIKKTTTPTATVTSTPTTTTEPTRTIAESDITTTPSEATISPTEVKATETPTTNRNNSVNPFLVMGSVIVALAIAGGCYFFWKKRRPVSTTK